MRQIHAVGCAGWLNPPTVGSVSFEGKPVVGEVPDGIGVVFQEDSSFPWLTVRDNVAFGLRHAGVEFSDHHGQHVRIGSWPFQNALPAWAVARRIRIAFSALTMLGSRS
jgi:ABC-type sugar transport system ATPase subunit